METRGSHVEEKRRGKWLGERHVANERGVRGMSRNASDPAEQRGGGGVDVGFLLDLLGSGEDCDLWR